MSTRRRFGNADQVISPTEPVGFAEVCVRHRTAATWTYAANACLAKIAKRLANECGRKRTYEDDNLAMLVAAGASGLIPKDADPEALVHALRRIANGE
ncbi:MAG: hypothetical protein JO314_10545 [Acidobacteria bacterium]|nr:hypothetical protein [Acidobacteriota bacterium]